jgi:hypothetical protein
VALVKSDVSEENVSKVFVALIPFTLLIEAIRSSETSVLERATRWQSPEDGILQAATNSVLIINRSISVIYRDIDQVGTEFFNVFRAHTSKN